MGMCILGTANAAIAGIDFNGYQVIKNNSNYDIDIYEKNNRYWDRQQSCTKGNPIHIKKGEVVVLCDSNGQSLSKVWSDTPRVQFEWWFKGGSGWKQLFSDQYLTYYNVFSSDPSQIILRLVENQDWNNAFEYKAIGDGLNPMYASTDFITYYVINSNNTITVNNEVKNFNSVDPSKLTDKTRLNSITNISKDKIININY